MQQQPRPFWRALAAFLLLPGIAAFVAPWFIRLPGTSFNLLALPLLAVGTGLLLWCVRDFYVVGRGTLAPWAPPENLVVVGLYRYSRNPMYLAVLLIIAGWALAFRSSALWIYGGCLALAFHLRLVCAEEPWLARTHAQQWATYKATVPRWLPGFRARRGA